MILWPNSNHDEPKEPYYKVIRGNLRVGSTSKIRRKMFYDYTKTKEP